MSADNVLYETGNNRVAITKAGLNLERAAVVEETYETVEPVNMVIIIIWTL